MVADAFFAAFRIPNLLRDLFAEGALSSAFVPVFKRELERQGKDAAFELAQVCFAALTVVLSVVCLIGILASPVLVRLIAPGFTDVPGKAELTASLTAIMFPFLLLVALAALAMSILNSFDRFAIPALAPALLNLGMIGAAFFICPYLEAPIFGMAIGVLIGGLGQLAIQLPSVRAIGMAFKFTLNLKHPGLREIGRLITPMIGGLAAGRVNIFVNTLLASLLISGAVSYLTYAYRVMHLPLGMIAVAIGTVALPKISAEAARRDGRGIMATYLQAIHLCFFLVIPVAAFFIVAGNEIISLLFEHGRFTSLDTYNTYQALIWYSLGLIGFAGVRVTTPVYYALKDAVRPMRYSIIAVVVNLAANAVFIPYLGFPGLAAATSAGGVVNLFLLILYLRQHLPEIRRRLILALVIRISLSSILMAFLVYYAARLEFIATISADVWGQIFKLALLGIIGIISYFIISFALRTIPSLAERDTPQTG